MNRRERAFVTAEGQVKSADFHSDAVCAALGHVWHSKWMPTETRGEQRFAGRSYDAEVQICSTCGAVTQ